MAGKFLEHYLQSACECSVVCWVDQHYESIKGELEICSPDSIKYLEFDYIIISIMRAKAVSEVKEYLAGLGIAPEKILWVEQKYIDNPLLLLKKATHKGKAVFERLEEYYI